MEFWGAKIVISKQFNDNYFCLNDKEIHLNVETSTKFNNLSLIWLSFSSLFRRYNVITSRFIMDFS